MSGSLNNTRINVAIRLRPLIQREINENAFIHWTSNGNIVKQVDPFTGEAASGLYNFDNVFGIEAQTDAIYQRIVSPIVLKAFQGFNGTIFCYGQTSSGKTYTLYGDEERNELGFIHFMSEQLFELTKNGNYMIKVGILEIYNDQLCDMLEPKNKVEIKEIDGVVTPIGMKEMHLFCKEDLDKLIVEVNSKRIVGETNMNTKSSRSHTIVRLIIENASTSVATKAFLNLVDLAGSEKVGQSGAEGQRFKEGTNINVSLSALAKVFHELSQMDNTAHCVGSSSPPLISSRQSTSRQSFSQGPEPQSVKASFKSRPKSRFVNFRDSKLTRILQSSLQGNAFIIMICNITPASTDETHSTLRFAKQAKTIKVEPEPNILPFNKRNKEEYEKIIEEFKSQLVAKDEEKVALQRRLEHVMRFCGTETLSDFEMKPPINRRQTVCGTELKKEGKHPSQMIFNPKTFDIFDKPKEKGDISELLDTSEDGISSEKFQTHSDTINYFSRRCESLVDSSDDSLEIPRSSFLPVTSEPDNRKRPDKDAKDEGQPLIKKMRMENETPVNILRIQRGVLRAEVEYQGIEYDELRNFHKIELDEKDREIATSQQYSKELEENMSKAYTEMQEIKKSLEELQERWNEEQEKYKELQKNKEFEVDIMNVEVQKKNKIIAQLKASLNQTTTKSEPNPSSSQPIPISASSQTDEEILSPLEFSLKAIEAECQTDPCGVHQSHQSLDPITWDSFQMDRDCQTDMFVASVFLDQALDPISWDKPQLDQLSQTDEEEKRPTIVQTNTESQTETEVIHTGVDAIEWEVAQIEQGSQTESSHHVHQASDPIVPMRNVEDDKSCQTEVEVVIKPVLVEIQCQTQECHYAEQGTDPVISGLNDQGLDPIDWDVSQLEIGCQTEPSILHQGSDPINWEEFIAEKCCQTLETDVHDQGVDPISFVQLAQGSQTEVEMTDESLDPISWDFAMIGQACQTEEKKTMEFGSDPVIWETTPAVNRESQTETRKLMDKGLDPVTWEKFQFARGCQTESKCVAHRATNPIAWPSTNVEKGSQTPQKNVFHKAVETINTWKLLEESFVEKMRLKDAEICQLKDLLMNEKYKAEQASRVKSSTFAHVGIQSKPTMTHRSQDASSAWKFMKDELHNANIMKEKKAIDFHNFKGASDAQIRKLQIELKGSNTEKQKLEAKIVDLRKLIASTREEYERAQVKDHQIETETQCDLLMELVEQSKNEQVELPPWIPNCKKLEKEITSLKLDLQDLKRDATKKAKEELEKESKKYKELYANLDAPPAKKKFFPPPPSEPIVNEKTKYNFRYNASRHCAMASRGEKIDIPSTSSSSTSKATSITNGRTEVPSTPSNPPRPEPKSKNNNNEPGERMTRSTSRKSIGKSSEEASSAQTTQSDVNGNSTSRATRKSLRKSNPRTDYNLCNWLDDEDEESISDFLISHAKK